MNQQPDPPPGLKRFPVGPLPTNCYLLGEAFLVDPGGTSNGLDQALDSIETLEAILLTHTHWDHIAGIEAVLEAYPDCRLLCHSAEENMLADPQKNFSAMQGDGIGFESDADLESCALRVDGEKLNVLETPGHSPGGVSFHWPKRNLVLSGDALFCEGVGRTDLPGSDRGVLDEALREVLLSLPDDTRVFPGHGPATTIGHEADANPFL
jgi:hydroxyacylglutathione hydrolase